MLVENELLEFRYTTESVKSMRYIKYSARYCENYMSHVSYDLGKQKSFQFIDVIIDQEFYRYLVV